MHNNAHKHDAQMFGRLVPANANACKTTKPRESHSRATAQGRSVSELLSSSHNHPSSTPHKHQVRDSNAGQNQTVPNEMVTYTQMQDVLEKTQSGRDAQHPMHTNPMRPAPTLSCGPLCSWLQCRGHAAGLMHPDAKNQACLLLHERVPNIQNRQPYHSSMST